MNPRQNISYDKTKFSGWIMHVNRAFPTKALMSFTAENDFDGIRGPFEQVLASEFARVYKGSISFNGQIYNLYIKQYLYRSVTDFLKHIVRPSRAARSLEASQMLAAESLLCPEVIAMGHKKIGPFVEKCFLITRSLEDAPDLSTRISKLTDPKTKRHFIRRLGETIGRMHSANISHGDIRPGNILVKRNDDSWDFYLLDNERTVKYNKLPDKLRFKNLVQLNMLIDKNLTRTDRMRFYKSYLEQNRQTISSAKKLAGQVMKRTNQRLSKKRIPNI